MSKYIEFVEDQEFALTHKTRFWYVQNHKHQVCLGWIKWYGGWRKYVFYSLVQPGEQVWYDADCMIKIGQFLQAATQEHQS